MVIVWEVVYGKYDRNLLNYLQEVIAASMHGLLRPTCNHNHKLLAAGSAEIKRNGIW